MNIWTILMNLGSIISFFKAFGPIIESLKNKQKPPVEQIKELLDQCESLLDSGIIDLPNVDEKAISTALKAIEDQLLK